jgi:hypothetical protein
VGKGYFEFLGGDWKIKVKWILEKYFFELVSSVFAVTLKCFDLNGCLVQCPKQLSLFCGTTVINSVCLLGTHVHIFAYFSINLAWLLFMYRKHETFIFYIRGSIA